MATAEELLQNAAETLSESVAEVCVIDEETRTINVPPGESLFGVTGDKDVERKYFQCPKIVGDNIDLSQHQIYIAYAFTSTQNSTVFPSVGINKYHCEDVKVSGDNITFSWKLSGNVLATPGFIAFKVMAAKNEGSNLKTKWNTAPAFGTVLITVPDGEEIAEEYPDIINQLFEEMEKVQEIATPEAMKGYVEAYMQEHPVTGGMTEEQEKQLDQNTQDVADLKSALPDKLDTNQGAENKGKVMIVKDDGILKPDDVNIADKSVTFNKLGEDIATKISVRPEYELLKSDITQYSGWIKFDELVNIMAIFSSTVTGNVRVYYTDEESGLDEQNPIYTGYPFYTAHVVSNRLAVTDENALKAKYIQIAFTQARDVTMSVYGLKKEESGQIELYSKGDSVNPSNKTLEVVGTYNGDTKYIECLPGESYTIEYESLNGRIGTGVLINGMFNLNPTTFPSMSNGMVVEVPQSANAIQIEYWVSKSTTVKVTGKFYGDLTRPSQKLVKENFDENILRYIRENIGGNVSGAVYYNCQDYGVIPGSSDNTDAMQALIDLVHENGGGVIWIPIGVYTFDSTNSSYDMTSNITTLLEAKSHVSILGESLSGSVLKVTGNTPQGAGLFCQNSVHSGEILEGCSYQNFTVDMSEASLTTYTHRGKAFYYSGIKDCVFRDLRLISTPSTSLGIDMLDNVVMDSVYVYEGGRQWTDGGNGGAGIGIGTGKWQNENYIIRNCVCDSCGHFGIFLEDQGIFSAAKDRNYPKGQIISNNVIRNGRNYALGVRGGKNVLVTGNNLYENKGGIYTDYGAINIVFSNNLIQGCTDAGFNYGNEMSVVNGADYPCENIVIAGNTFVDNATDIKKTHTPVNSQEVNNIFLDASF